MEWNKIRIGDAFSIKKGKKVISEEVLKKGMIRYIQIGDLRNNDNLQYCFYKDQYIIAQKNDIIIAWDGANAGICNYGLEGAIGSTLALLSPKQNNLYIPYIGKFIQSKFLYLRKNCTGATIPHLSRTILENLEIPLPPIEIQIKIAEALDKAQELIDNRKLQLEKYDELIQSTFIDMFGDPVTNPKKWEIKEIKKLIEGKISNGFFASNDNYEDKGTQIIWISDFINKFYSNITQLKRVVISEKDLEKNLVEYGDAIFCRSSLTKEGIGKCAIIPEFLEEKIIYECHIIKIKLNMKIIIPEFFRAYSDLTYFRNQIMKYSKTSTMTTISQEGILKGLVYLPPLEKQLKFKNIVTKIFEKKRLCEESLKQMEENFNSMIDKAFKGELF